MRNPFSNIDMLDDAMADILRQKTDAERLAMVDQMWRFARDLLRANIAREHPDWSEEEVNRLVAWRLSQRAV